MGKCNFTPKQMILGLLMLVLADVLFLLLGAVLLERKVLGFDCINVWSLISLLVAAVCSASFSALMSGTPRSGYLLAVFGVLFLIFLPTVSFGAKFTIGSFTKNILSLFCGTLIGNFLGMTAYHRTQKNRVRKTSWEQ